MRKNVASQAIGAQMITAADGSAFTGSVTVSVTGDAGTQATGSVGSGACTHEGNGYHTYAPAQAETNYNLVAFTFTGTGAIPVTVQVYTSFPQTGDSFALIGATGSGLTSLASQASVDTLDNFVDTEIADIQARLPAALVGGRMDANVGAISGDATAADNAEAFFDGTGYAGTNNVIPTVTTLTNLPAITANWLTAAGTAADFTTEIQSGLATAAALATVDDFLDTEIAAIITAIADVPTVAEFEARTPTAAQLAYIVANAATGFPVTFTTSGGSTTAAVLALVDGGSPSATNDQYNGRLLVFTDGTLKGVVTDITDYVGGTTTATITAIPTAPTSSHNARLI